MAVNTCAPPKISSESMSFGLIWEWDQQKSMRNIYPSLSLLKCTCVCECDAIVMRTDYLNSIGQFTMQKLHLLNFVRHCNANTHSKTYTQSYTIRFDLFSLENDKEYCANVICVCVDVSFDHFTPPFLVFITIYASLCAVYHFLVHTQPKKKQHTYSWQKHEKPITWPKRGLRAH